MKRSQRWTVALAVPALIAAGSVAVALPASAVNLPDLTAEEVLLLMNADVQGFSGTVVKTSDLGLPALEMSSMVSSEMVAEMEENVPEGFENAVPSVISQSTLTEAITLLASDNTMRVFASELGMRVQILDQMSQRDLIVTENGFWAYDSKNATAVTGSFEGLVTDDQKLAAEAQAEDKPQELAVELNIDLTNPDSLATAVIAAVEQDATISVGNDQLVAGRGAYTLTVEPNSPNSLIDRVVVAVDGETGLVLDVKMFSVEQDNAALSMGFESVSFAVPDASLFAFSPPPGTTVETLEMPAIGETTPNVDAAPNAQAKPEVIGDGWDAVMHLSTLPEDINLDMFENELFADLMTQVDGGKVFSTPVANVLITDDGQVYAGSVTVDFLLQVAAR